MIRVDFTVTLVADAEPGTGLGTELLADVVSRDHSGRPVLRATHLKGLMRDRLAAIAQTRGWNAGLADAVLGRPGTEGDDGTSGAFCISDAIAAADAKVRTTTRTAVGELGTVVGKTLRTTEAVAAESVFRGTLSIDAAPDTALDLAARLALLAIDAVGGGRNRGSGACVIKIQGEQRSPGTLLRALDDVLRTTGVPVPALSQSRGGAKRAGGKRLAEGEPTVFRLLFRAQGPVCCPETPLGGTNVVRGGFAIPASAVQGAIISRLARTDGELAGACFDDWRFRAWPLLPCGVADDGDTSPVPVRVSLSHRMSKLRGKDGHDFCDHAIKPYDWRTATAGSPLKATDGVLLRALSGDRVRLWRASDMPRLITAHAVHHDASGAGQRNLYTVEAMAPLAFSGWLTMPPAAAEALQTLLAADPHLTLGRARGVSGSGRLELVPSRVRDIAGLSLAGDLQDRIFVLQSPAAIPDDWQVEEAGGMLARLVAESRWGSAMPPPVDTGREPRVRLLAHCGVRFGWNRHGIGTMKGSNRVRARRVVLPGSVFVLQKAPTDLDALLVSGLGVETPDGDRDGRSQGFGAVLPHPGIATSVYDAVAGSPPELRSRDDSASTGYQLWSNAGANGPSPSQIGAVIEQLGRGKKEALAYLDRQRDRPPAVWQQWQGILKILRDLVDTRNADAVRAGLRVWQDLAVARRAGREERR
jgi:hypothetical protein